ncbi:CHAT domain-containing protein [Suillus paluster]|uniref:CHAT domain-containing protein n=1 Tax=Suillus paluster TaxID=48578 RepID=UPI001B86244B|nr:CHAT domain-containing protein [Suillus paluster]KAG1752378.1 CHAT domain-containing protein [Suillus paluster]
MLPEFSHFLLPPLLSDLQKAVENGPVIIVNASRYSCDALIILSVQVPVHVSQLSSEFQSLINRADSSDHQLESHKLVAVLRKLWDGVVGSCIWWCPTAEFTLLPLHAAGPYQPNSHAFSHFYISSYGPTLATLIRARRQVSRHASVQHFVAIGQANPSGGKELRCVAAELDIVAQRVALPVLYLYLACHGMPNRKQPFESSFTMHDGPLMTKDIMRTRLQGPKFALLLACYTTVGDELSPDEAIHLAAAMQFSGFRSIIGSMWPVDDGVAGQIVSLFYDNVVDDSGRLDCRRAAGALHKAVKTSRKNIPFEQQILFVHIGV